MISKQIYGLIGHPVKHSLSAAMHNAAFAYLGINAEYKLFDILPENLEDFLKPGGIVKDIEGNEIDKKNIKGFNVTIPHKEAVLKFVLLDDEKSYGVKEIQAVNTIIVNENGTLNGFNTDHAGFSQDVIINQAVDAKRTAMIGAGGAAKAVAFVLRNVAEVVAVFDVDKNRSSNLAAKIRKMAPTCNAYAVNCIGELKIKDKTFLVNASPVGMKEQDPLLITEDMLHKDLFVYDLIYNPEKTKLLKFADSLGIKNSNGLKMLLYQGTLAFEHWTGQSAPEDIMFKALQKALEN